GNKRFFGGVGRAIALEPMTDEQVGAKADQFPKDKHHHEIVRQHNAEHREHEERERGEVAGDARVIAHVAKRVDVNESAYSANENKHRHAQGIEGKADRHSEEPVDFNPWDFSNAYFRFRKNDTAANETN